MNIKDRWHYLNIFLDLSNNWLHRPVAEKELSYLKKRLSSEKYIDYFKFGFFPYKQNHFIDFMDEFGIITKEDPEKIFNEIGILYLYYSKQKTFFRNNTLLIPFFDIYGNVVSISGRTMSSQENQKKYKISKYKHLPFSKKYYVFGLDKSYNEILKNNKVVIVEGQFDFYSLYSAGIKNCVALCGSKLIFQQILLLKRFTNNFYLLLDNDEAGEEGINKAKNQSKKYRFNFNKLKIDFEKDVDDFIKVNNWDININDFKIEN
jgi:DNA primase